MTYKDYNCTPQYSDVNKKYFATIPGVESISADSLEEFERKFHQAVDDHLARKGHNSSTIKIGKPVIAIGIGLALLLLLIVTCPKKQQHLDTISDRLSGALYSELEEEEDDWDALGLLFGGALLDEALEDSIVVDNYFIFSIGKLLFDGEKNVVSFGILGHVFTASEKKLEENLI